MAAVMTCAAMSTGAVASDTAAAADSAYKAGKFSDAAILYGGVAEREGTSAGLLYNMGNAYYQCGDLGNARLCLERASLLDPSERLIENNLAYIASKVEDENRSALQDKKLSVAPAEMGFFENLYHSFVLGFSSETWAVNAAVAFVLFICCLTLYLFSRNVFVRKVGFFGGGVLAVACVCCLYLSFASARAVESHNDGVVMAFKTRLLASPDASAKSVTSPLCRGTKLQVLAEENGPDGRAVWYKVRLNDDFVGWIQARDFEVI